MAVRSISGIRFDPPDLVLVKNFLLPIAQTNVGGHYLVPYAGLYEREPWLVTGAGVDESAMIGSARYCYTTRKRNYPGGWLDRDAGNGHWKTAEEHEIKDENGAAIAIKKAMTYYVYDLQESSVASSRGSCKKRRPCRKTHWLMDEYELAVNEENSKFQRLAICKIKCNKRIFRKLGDGNRREKCILLAVPDNDDPNLLPEGWDFMPPGYKFSPTLYELFTNYLWFKDTGYTELIPSGFVQDGDVYGMEPWILTAKILAPPGSDANGDARGAKTGATGPDGRMEERYYFTRRTVTIQYCKQGGKRTAKLSRRAGNGLWRNKGRTKEVQEYQNGYTIGYVHSMTYFRLTSEDHVEKTDWVMKEYIFVPANNNKPGTFQGTVICKIKHLKVEESADRQQLGTSMQHEGLPVNDFEEKLLATMLDYWMLTHDPPFHPSPDEILTARRVFSLEINMAPRVTTDIGDQRVLEGSTGLEIDQCQSNIHMVQSALHPIQDDPDQIWQDLEHNRSLQVERTNEEAKSGSVRDEQSQAQASKRRCMTI